MVAARFADHQGALLRQAIEPERREEHVQQTSNDSCPARFRHRASSCPDHLAVTADELPPAPYDAADARDVVEAEILFEAWRVAAEGAEHKTGKDFDAQPARAHALPVAIGRHAALAGDATAGM